MLQPLDIELQCPVRLHHLGHVSPRAIDRHQAALFVAHGGHLQLIVHLVALQQPAQRALIAWPMERLRKVDKVEMLQVVELRAQHIVQRNLGGKDMVDTAR